MPLFDVQCRNNHIEEILIKADDPVPNCSCGAERKKLPALFARTPGLFGDTEGHYSSALGCYIENSSHRDRLMKERNLVHAEDYGNDRIDSALDRQRNAAAETDRYLEQYNKVFAETNCPLTAMEKASEIAPTAHHTKEI